MLDYALRGAPLHRYSPKWAWAVVQELLWEHARVREPFLNLTGLTPTFLAALLEEGRPEWQNAKDLLKALDKACHANPVSTQTAHAALTTLLKCKEGLPVYPFWKALTDHVARAKIKSRFLDGVIGEVHSPPEAVPLSTPSEDQLW